MKAKVKAKAETIKLTCVIQCAPELIFEALTNSAELSQWLSREACIEPRQGGRVEVRWNADFEARGEFTTFSPPKKLAFTWQGTGEPGETSVTFALKPVVDGTKITLTHVGFGTGRKWAGRAQEAERGWKLALDNLKALLETGISPREARQPRLGMGFETAEGGKGTLVLQVIPDSPAEQAGLRKDDIITRMAGQKTPDEGSFLNVFYQCQAGQKVKVTYVRNGKRRTTTLGFGTRPVPEISENPAEVAEQARQTHEQSIAALRTAVAVLTDEQADLAPAEGEWSVKQILAHLCVCEPAYRMWAVNTLLGQEPGWTEARLPEQFASVLGITPTMGGLLDRLEHELAESRMFVAALTPEHRAYKARCRRIALTLLDFAWHVNLHLEQVQKTVKAVQEL